VRVLLNAVDAVAKVLALLGFIFLIFTSVAWGVSGVFQYLHSIWDSEDRILLIIVGVAVAWCAFRWKELSKHPQDANSVELETPERAKEETPFERFKRLTGRVVSVPRAETQKRELKWKNDRKKHETHKRHR
jgi:hypothetical protein